MLARHLIMKLSAKIVGGKALIGNLKVNDRVIDKALSAAGMYVEGEAKKLCPVKYNYMRNHITHYKSPDQPQTEIIAVNTDYAIYQEFGDYKHKIGFSPFLRPALWNNKPQIMAILKARMR